MSESTIEIKDLGLKIDKESSIKHLLEISTVINSFVTKAKETNSNDRLIPTLGSLTKNDDGFGWLVRVLIEVPYYRLDWSNGVDIDEDIRNIDKGFNKDLFKTPENHEKVPYKYVRKYIETIPVNWEDIVDSFDTGTFSLATINIDRYSEYESINDDF